MWSSIVRALPPEWDAAALEVTVRGRGGSARLELSLEGERRESDPVRAARLGAAAWRFRDASRAHGFAWKRAVFEVRREGGEWVGDVVYVYPGASTAAIANKTAA
jgi:hypothetical protein